MEELVERGVVDRTRGLWRLDPSRLDSFQVPNLPAFSGVRLAAQSGTLEVTSGAVYLGNTASLVFQ